jgi:hypothetical protein
MTHPVIPRLLIISGTGRNAGKTMLACTIIQKFHDLAPIIALKISPHHHAENSARELGPVIMEEFSKTTGKDSARMLSAGAARSFFITAEDSELPEVVSWIMNFHGNCLFVAESGGLRDFAVPGLYFIVSDLKIQIFKPSVYAKMKYAHTLIRFDGENLDFDPGSIAFHNNEWRTRA